MELFELSKKHLKQHGLFGKASDTTPPISFDLPKLQGRTLDEHFFKLGREASEPYLGYAKEFSSVKLPSRPTEWTRKSGWTKYCEGKAEPVLFPDEKMLVFDVEVLYKESPFAIMACAASPTAWYAWISPWIIGENDSPKHLIPLGNPEKARIVVGHNVGYDRARISDEYDIKQTNSAFLDTMSLHVAVNGMCSQQRPTWMKYAKKRALRERFQDETDNPHLIELLQDPDEEADLWVSRSTINSLREVALFHCDKVLDKSVREEFGTLDRQGVLGKLNLLLDYCAADVEITHNVFKEVLKRFLDVCPHPVSFAALRHLCSVILPVNRSWETYIQNAERKYQELAAQIVDRLVELCENALKLKEQDTSEKDAITDGSVAEEKPKPYEMDLWLGQLDWSGQEIRYKKVTKKNPVRVPVANQKMPGMPKWYKGLFPKASGPISLSVRTRIAPLLLRMCWDTHPLIWSDIHGWTFRVAKDEAERYANTPVVKVSMAEEKCFRLKDDLDHVYFKIPHKDGPLARCTNPLAKAYLRHFESGMLSSEYALAKEALEMNAMCSYWISARERIRSQMVVYQSDLKRPDADPTKPQPAEASHTSTENPPELGFILPQVIPMGTITRRAVERTWLTASNAKKNRVGSELKAMVTAPPGYVFVGADVDSEELWIASLVGDAQFGLHGGGALGFMTLEGNKSAGTDLHSKTAEILGISRGSAKVFNYGRIYGAGVKFAATLLRQFNPRLSDADALKTAQKLYEETKGKKVQCLHIKGQPFWRGGSESLVFNKLEEFANQQEPRTPVLGAAITEALQQKYIKQNGFLTSRINWAIQSSGVDYLHLLIVSMNYLIRRYGLDARLALTVHDEIRYLVKKEHRYKVSKALQVANVWTRAMFSQQMGIEDLPQSCAWFSAVDIDTVLRKEVDLDCVTPSHPDPIPSGESLDIQTLLTKGSEAVLDESEGADIDLESYEYKPGPRVMEDLGGGCGEVMKIWRLRAQIATEDEWRVLLKEISAKIKLMKEAALKESKERAEVDPPSLSAYVRSAGGFKWEGVGSVRPVSISPATKPKSPTKICAEWS